MKRKQTSVLLFVGLLIMSLSIVITRYTHLPDFISGLITGIGIGIVILGFIRQRPNPSY